MWKEMLSWILSLVENKRLKTSQIFKKNHRPGLDGLLSAYNFDQTKDFVKYSAIETNISIMK